jgi:hypothetical protein
LDKLLSSIQKESPEIAANFQYELETYKKCGVGALSLLPLLLCPPLSPSRRGPTHAPFFLLPWKECEGEFDRRVLKGFYRMVSPRSASPFEDGAEDFPGLLCSSCQQKFPDVCSPSLPPKISSLF